MAIVFDASTDVIYRTASLPVMNGGPYTVSFWFYLVTAPTGGDSYQSLWCLNTNASTHYDQVGIRYSGGNVRLYVALDNGTYSESVGSTNLSTSTWYFVQLVRSSTTSLIAYLNGTSEATQSNTASTSTPTRMDFGVHPAFSTDDFKGRAAAFKIWTAAQSASERENERWTYAPSSYASLNGWWPCFSGSGERIRDYSGNGRDWTEGGTLTDADGPGLRWGLSTVSGYYIPAAAGGPITGTADITLAALTSSGAGTLPIVGTLTGTLAALTTTATGALPIVGQASITLDSLTASGAGVLPIAGVVSVTLGALTATATGALPIVGNASITLGALTASGAGALPIVGQANVTLDALTVTAIGALPIAGNASISLGELTAGGAGVLPIVGTLTATLEALTLSAYGSGVAGPGERWIAYAEQRLTTYAPEREASETDPRRTQYANDRSALTASPRRTLYADG